MGYAENRAEVGIELVEIRHTAPLFQSISIGIKLKELFYKRNGRIVLFAYLSYLVVAFCGYLIVIFVHFRLAAALPCYSQLADS